MRDAGSRPEESPATDPFIYSCGTVRAQLWSSSDACTYCIERRVNQPHDVLLPYTVTGDTRVSPERFAFGAVVA